MTPGGTHRAQCARNRFPAKAAGDRCARNRPSARILTRANEIKPATGADIVALSRVISRSRNALHLEAWLFVHAAVDPVLHATATSVMDNGRAKTCSRISSASGTVTMAESEKLATSASA